MYQRASTLSWSKLLRCEDRVCLRDLSWRLISLTGHIYIRILLRITQVMIECSGKSSMHCYARIAGHLAQHADALGQTQHNWKQSDRNQLIWYAQANSMSKVLFLHNLLSSFYLLCQNQTHNWQTHSSEEKCRLRRMALFLQTI